MLAITVPEVEVWNEKNQEFHVIKEQKLKLEHSLVSISKWESKWKQIFFSKTPKTYEQTIDYIKCMTITQNVNPEVYSVLTNENIEDINEYIQDPMSATTFSDNSNVPNREIISSELIYYWMIAMNIPMECQKWHINRLLTLIRICGIKNQPNKKMSRSKILSRNAALNAARRQKLKSKG